MAADLWVAAGQQHLRLLDAWKNVAPAPSEGWTAASSSSMSLDHEMGISSSISDLPVVTPNVFDGPDSSCMPVPALFASGTSASAFNDSSRAQLASPPPHILPSTFANPTPYPSAPAGPSALADIPADSRPPLPYPYIVPPPLTHVRPPPSYDSLAPSPHPSSIIFPSISTSTSPLYNYPNPTAPIYRPLPLPSVPVVQPHRPSDEFAPDPPVAVDADTAISKRLSGLGVDEPVNEERVGRAWSRAVQNRERRRASFALDGWGFGAGC